MYKLVVYENEDYFNMVEMGLIVAKYYNLNCKVVDENGKTLLEFKSLE